jgi:DNA polymerase V
MHALLPLYLSKVSAGFPSPAEDDIVESLNLNHYLIKNPASTFIMRANELSLLNTGIDENDLLIIDRNLTPTHGKIVIALIDGQLVIKTIMTDDTRHPSMEEVRIYGVITYVIHGV